MTDTGWHPGASLAVLQQGAILRRLLRDWFDNTGTLEVSTPLLSRCGTTDPNIQSLVLSGEPSYYLHTSPEFAMKRLLAAHGQDLYQIVPVFRADEKGRRHNPEFTLVEWYRVGIGLAGLIDELCRLFQALCADFQRPWHKPDRVSYVNCLARCLERPFGAITVPHLREYFVRAHRPWPDALQDHELDAALDLFMDEFVLPGFADDRLTCLVEYPASQASLARTSVSADGVPVAERVELYWGALELANGFHELSDATEQRSRFELDNATRVARGLAPVPIDEHLLAALSAGLPECSGVALGFERLLMVLGELRCIQEAMSFDIDRA